MATIQAGFIGFGLIGGSIARAIRETVPDSRLIAYNYHYPRPNENLEQAKAELTLDSVSTDLSDFSTCNLIFLCAPVLTNIEYLTQLKGIIRPDCILTDVGSVKGNIHDAISELGLEAQFIGGHPMTGSEKVGYSNSNAKILENAYYILTPTTLTQDAQIDYMYHLVEQMGAIPVVLDAKEHDNIVAAISHMPHIIATTLVNLVKHSDDAEEKMKALAAGGFRDITRIASSSPIMWQNICLTNTESIIRFLKKYIRELSHMMDIIDAHKEDALYELFESAKEYRDSMPLKGAGLIDKIHEVYLDIIDETGAIATIATILASNHISIRNIGIIHNREFQEGVLRIEFYDGDSSMKAVELLRKYSYTIYER